jgi:hypothetical protein
MLLAFGAVKQFLMRMPLFSHDAHNSQNTHFAAEKQHVAGGLTEADLPPSPRCRNRKIGQITGSRAGDGGADAGRRPLALRRPASTPQQTWPAPIDSKFSPSRGRRRFYGRGRPDFFANHYRTNLAAKNLLGPAQIVANRFDSLRADLLIMSSSLSPLTQHTILKGELPLSSLG